MAKRSDEEDLQETEIFHVPQDAEGFDRGHESQMMIKVTRPVYTQARFDDLMPPTPKHRKTLRERFNDISSKCQCSGACMRKAAAKAFPFVRTLRGYSLKDDFVSDLVSGLTVGIMHIPQGMAYGMLTNLPPVYGLYISFFPVLIYFFFGQSRHISMGTFAVVSLMTGVVVDKANCSPSLPSTNATTMQTSTGFDATTSAYMENSTAASQSSGNGEMSHEELMCKVGYAVATNLMVGIYQLGMGVLQLGFVTIYMSEPLTRAFTTGAAIYVFTSQIKHIFGITTGKYSGMFKLVYMYRDFFTRITTTNVASLVMGCICMLIIHLTKQFINPRVKAKIKMPVPIELIMIIIGTIVSYFGKFEEIFGMKVVGEIPFGIPAPRVPPVSILPEVATDAIGIAMVAFAVNISLGQLFAKKHNYELPANSELVAYGLTNISTSFLNCYTSAASLSRSLIQEAVGGKTQVAGLVSCCLLLVVLYGVGPLFEQLPNNVLASIVLVNLKGMFLQFEDLKKLWYICKYDFAIWLVTFVAVCILDADLGLFCGIGFSLLTVVFRTQSPYTCLMGRVPHTDIYKDISVYQNCQEIPGVKIFRFESSLYYANTDHFVNKLFHKCRVNPRKLRAKQIKAEKKIALCIAKEEKKGRIGRSSDDDPVPMENGQGVREAAEIYPVPKAPIHAIIIDCSAMSYLDSVAVTTLTQVMEEYRAVGVMVSLTGCKAGVREMLDVAGFFEKIPSERLFPSIHDALILALKENRQLRQKLEDDPTNRETFESLCNILHTSSEGD